jgi:hypothetical protein
MRPRAKGRTGRSLALTVDECSAPTPRASQAALSAAGR